MVASPVKNGMTLKIVVDVKFLVLVINAMVIQYTPQTIKTIPIFI
jgi:hypothetical protein